MATKTSSSAGRKKTSAGTTQKKTSGDAVYQQRVSETFKKIHEQLKLVNLEKNQTRTFSTYTKSRLRTYLKNPKTNENNLRQLSYFLYRYCQPYRKTIWYYATMYSLNSVSIIPSGIDITKNYNVKKIKKNWNTTAKKFEQMALDQCMLPMFITAWIGDLACGYIHDDGNTFFIQVLNSDYCKVSAIDGGALRYAFDFTYFTTYPDDLALYPKEFQQKYKKYQNDSTLRWQELDYAHEICLKVNSDDLTLCMPPFVAMFEEIIDNVDLRSIENVKDNLSIYKLLVARLQPLSSAQTADDFEIDVPTALEYYNKLCNALPEEVSAILSPMPIDTIEFEGSTTDDTDMISNSNKNIFKNATSSPILYSDDTGTTISGLKAIADENTVLKALLPQVQSWLNIYLDYVIGNDHAKVRFLEIGPYTRANRKKEFLESATYSLPEKLAAAAMDGFTPLEAMSLSILENECLELSTAWEPLQSSHTQSSTSEDPTTATGGRPTSDSTDLTDAGADTRDDQK